MPNLSQLVMTAFIGCWLMVSPTWAARSLDQQRPIFLRAEQAIQQGSFEEADGLLPDLADYPLLPHLLYLKLKRNLDNAQTVQDFLDHYGQTRQAGMLRRHWLERLAGQGAWAEYIRQYRETNSPNLQCGYFFALAQQGRNAEAWAGAERLWATGESLPPHCEQLFGLWQASPSFPRGQIWIRFALAMRRGNRSLADSLQPWLPEAQRPQAELWRRIQANPKLVLDCSLWNAADPLVGPIFAHGIDRLASDDPVLAQTAWALHKNRFSIDPEESSRLDRRTALALAAQRHGQAWAYLMEMPKESVDDQIRAWRVRTALAQLDWPGALLATEWLSPEEKGQAQWHYWRARALEALGNVKQAEAEYRSAATERDFFGISAADKTGADYPLRSQDIPATEADLDRLASTPPFLAINEWRALKRENEARSEWLHAIQSLTLQELLVAAKLAQRLGLDNLAIQTAAKAGHWDDLPLRYPLGFYEPVLQAASLQQVEPALVYALVRRESAFDPNVGSSAGAIGLMQLLPSTGALMARQLNEVFPGANALLNPVRNLRLGTTYLRGLLDRFGNHFAVAAAAYNAGPNRVERWLPKHQALPGDIWVETIPFSETRQYVAAVLAHAMVYRARLNQPLPRLHDWLPDVPPSVSAEEKPERIVSVPLCE